MNPEILYRNSVGSLYCIENNFLYVQYVENNVIQLQDYEAFIINISEYVSENGKVALIVNVPENTDYSAETWRFINNRKYQGSLSLAIAVVGSIKFRKKNSEYYHDNLKGVVPSQAFVSFIEAFKWIQQYLLVAK